MAALDVTVDTASPVPLYHQIASQLQDSVEQGRIAKGEFLPSEVELAESWGVSRPTARRAIQSLVEHGLLLRRRGVGTQVVGTQVRRPVRLSSLYDDLAASGRSPMTEVLRFERIAAEDEVAEALQLPDGDLVLHIERLRGVDGTPIAFMRNWLVLSSVEGVEEDDLATRGLYDLLRDRGVHPRRATQVIGAGAARPEEADKLQLEPGAPVLYMRRVMFDDNERAVELGKHVYNPQLYEMTVELTV